MSKSVVLLSGGMDSATALAMAAQESDEVIAVSVRYGSQHSLQEMRSAKKIAAVLGASHEIVTLPSDIFSGAGSALMGESVIPEGEYHDPQKETPSVTVVPFRNANLIAVATSIAEARGADKVWVATHLTDHLGWAYPDCSPEFIGAMANAVYVGTMHKVRLVAPFLMATKADIVTKAASLYAPLQHTWSCYRGGVVSCGACPTCVERLKAFTDAGYIDPIDYAVDQPQPSFGLKVFPYGN